MAKKLKYYSLSEIQSYGAKYNIIFGERSNGKSYALKLECIKTIAKGKKFAIIRRLDEDFKMKRGTQYFEDCLVNGELEKLHIPFGDGLEANTIVYRSKRYYLGYVDYETMKVQTASEPCGYCFSISSYEHDKSTSYPDVTTVVFEEFITRSGYLPDEFVLFQNVLSTIIRERVDVTIYMLGNTVNQYCPYFAEMGLKNIKKIEKGSIQLYRYGETGLTVAVQYCDGLSKDGKPSDIYFAFDNPKIKMITQGDWEMEIYPHLPMKYTPRDVKRRFYIQFKEELLECEIIRKNHEVFVYVHQKTSPLKNNKKDIIFSTEMNVSKNYNRNILRPTGERHKMVTSIMNEDNTFYQSNTVGEIMRNYLLWCMDN